MADDDDAPVEDIAPSGDGGGGFDIGAFAKRYWYVLLAVALVVGFVLYKMFVSKGAVSTPTDTYQGFQSGQPNLTSATQPDISNLVDMLSTQYQTIQNELQQMQGNPPPNPPPQPPGGWCPPAHMGIPCFSGPPPIIGWQPAQRAPVNPSAPASPGPRGVTPMGGGAFDAGSVFEAGSLAPDASASDVGMGGASKATITGFAARVNPRFGKGGRAVAVHVMHGHHPMGGPAVPFGTMVQSFVPLHSSGRMYATDRRV